MKTLRYKSQGETVHVLEQLLSNLNYKVKVSTYFGVDTHRAVMDFQRANNLVVDGIVGMKTWSKLIALENSFISFNDKFLSEQDLVDFSEEYGMELAVVKAVNEVESNGKGFLVSGRPRILFEGHVFWKELVKRNLEPKDYLTEYNSNVLYHKWSRTHYEGGAKEYDRLEKAAGISDFKAFHDSAYSSASWGAYQIMGYHYKSLGYYSIDQFVSKMYEHEREHLKAFGKFIEQNNLVSKLREKNWVGFARRYNGAGFASNNYDTKLKNAYEKYTNLEA